MNRDTKLAAQIASGVIDFLKKIGKEEALPSIVELLQKEQSLKKAYVYTPMVLKEVERKKITREIIRITGEAIESFVFEIDENLIDGVKIYYKDKLWDFSLSSQISKFLSKT